jgi:hypothetical protein
MKFSKPMLRELILEELHMATQDSSRAALQTNHGVEEGQALKEALDFAKILQNPAVQKVLQAFVEEAVEKLLGSGGSAPTTTRSALGAAAEE